MQALVRRHSTALALSLLTILGLLAYANGLRNDFHFDDYEGLLHNPALRDLRNIPAFFTDPVIFRLTYKLDWRPILQITYALDYAIGGLDPVTFHATDLLFHIATAWMIFLIVGEILKQTGGRCFSLSTYPTTWLALAPAMLFLVHTANSQTVNYSWARSSLLAALFYIVACYCHVRGAFKVGERGSALWHTGALVAFAFSLGSKATAVSFSGMLLVYEALLLNPAGQNPMTLYLKEPRRLLKHLPTLAVLIAYIWLRSTVTPHVTGRFISDSWISRKTYLFTQFRAWVYYLKLYVWPDPLILDYPGFGWSRSLFDVKVLAALAVVLTITIAAWRARKTEPLLSFFTFWFFIALLPEASIIVRPDAVTGHRPYLAYAGLSVAAALFALKIAHMLWRRMRWPERRFASICGAALALVIVALTAATITRNLDWRDDLTLWTDVLKKDPTNIRAYVGLGMQYIDRTEYTEAREILDEAVRLAPEKSEGYLYRGNLNAVVGNYEEALSDLNRALAQRHFSIFALVYRGDVYRDTGRYPEALKDYESALRVNPSFPEAYYGIAMVHWQKKELPEATTACRKLLDLEPDYPRSYICLGSLLMHQELFGEALKIYYAGASRFPTNSGLWYGLGTAYEELGLYKEAQHSYDKSTLLATDSSSQPKDSLK